MNRLHAREKRAKDEQKSKFKDELLKEVVDKGEVKNPSCNYELHDLNSVVDGKILTGYGGGFQQIYFVVTAVMELHEQEINAYYKRKQENPGEVNRATNAIELMLEQYFIPFLIGYLKDMKADSFTFVATPQVKELLESFKIGLSPTGFYELAKMNKDQYLQFRHMFVERRMCKPMWESNKNSKAMELLLSSFC